MPSEKNNAGSVLVITHPVATRHDPGPNHLESKHRITAIADLLNEQTDIPIEWATAREADRADVLEVHSTQYLESLEEVSRAGGGALDTDTSMSADSLEAAFRAAGAAIQAAESALNGKPAFSAMRPPGHHAGRDVAMGFCFFNNVVIAAKKMLTRADVERVLIIDWDVHHGNGTQDLIESDERIRFVSLHQFPYYPGTGAAEEKGCGNIFNVPRPGGLPAATYVADLLEAVFQATHDWKPDLLLVSAGFDAMKGDPLGGFTLEPEDYALLTEQFLKTGCPIASVLEGGYDPGRLAAGVLAHLVALGNAPTC